MAHRFGQMSQRAMRIIPRSRKGSLVFGVTSEHDLFVRPTVFPKQPRGLQFHYYSLYDFVSSAWGKTIWRSNADKALLLQYFTLFHNSFTIIPSFLGEFGAYLVSTELAAWWKWSDYLVREQHSGKQHNWCERHQSKIPASTSSTKSEIL
jgi:hypothetical protein